MLLRAPESPRPHARIWLVVAVLALPLLGSPAPAAEDEPALRLLRLIDSASAGASERFQAFDTPSPNLADLLGDGRLQLVTQNDNLVTYVLDPVTGKVVAELATHRPGDGTDWGARDINGAAIGDVDGDGELDLAVLNSAAELSLFSVDRANSTASRMVLHERWNATASAVVHDPDFYETHPWYPKGTDIRGADGHPYIAEVPGEDGAWVFLQSDSYPGHFAFDATGELRWLSSWWDGNAGPWVGPLQDGKRPRAVFATDDGHVVAYDAKGGERLWTFAAREHGAEPGSIAVMPTVSDLDGDGDRSILVSARVAVNDSSEDWMERQHARYFLLDHRGQLVWEATYPWGNPHMYTHPAVLDVDRDDVLDFVVLDWNTIGHKPGKWEHLGPANLFAISGADGRALWRTPVNVTWSNQGIAIAPFTGQGQQILVSAQSHLGDGLALYDLRGKRVAWQDLPDGGWRVTRGAVLADIDGDGTLEALVALDRPAQDCPRKLDVGCREGAIAVYATQAPAGQAAHTNHRWLNDAVDNDGATARGRLPDWEVNELPPVPEPEVEVPPPEPTPPPPEPEPEDPAPPPEPPREAAPPPLQPRRPILPPATTASTDFVALAGRVPLFPLVAITALAVLGLAGVVVLKPRRVPSAPPPTRPAGGRMPPPAPPSRARPAAQPRPRPAAPPPRAAPPRAPPRARPPARAPARRVR